MATKTTPKTAAKATQTTLDLKPEVKEVVEEKAPAKKAPAKKTTPAKKTAETKTAAKKTTTAKKTTAKKTTKAAAEVKAEVFVQYQGMETSEKEIMDKVIAAWEAEGKKASAIKRVKLYVKPEDYKVYFVINEGLKNCSTGAVEL